MKVSQERLPASQIALEIEVPAEVSQKAYEGVVRDLSRSANIPGFRKGKVPRKILLQRMGQTRIKAAALEKLLQDSLKAAIDKEKIEAIGEFQLRSSMEELIEKFDPTQPLIFSASVDVPPEAKLGDFTGWSLQVEEVKYAPEKVDDFLQQRRTSTATLVPVEGRAAQMGDIAVVDFVGHFAPEGDADESGEATSKEIPGGQAQDFQVELAEGQFIPGFVEGMVGMEPGETKEVSAQFPEEYVNEELSGQAAVFSVTLKEIKERELPELDDEFAQDISEFETLEELRSHLESQFKEEAEKKTSTNRASALLKQLLENTEIELPNTLIDQEVNQMLAQMAFRLSKQGIDPKQMFTQDSIPTFRNEYRPEAIQRLKEEFAVKELAKRESIDPTEDAIAARREELLEQLAGEDIDRDKLESLVVEEETTKAVLDWLGEQSTIEWVPEGTLTEESEAEEASEDAESEEAGVPEALETESDESNEEEE